MKKTIAVLLAVLCLLSLGACGKSAKAESSPSPVASPSVEKTPAVSDSQPKAEPLTEEAEPVAQEWVPTGAINLIISRKIDKAAADSLAKFVSKYSGQSVVVIPAADTGAELEKAEKNGRTLGLLSFSEIGFHTEEDSIDFADVVPVCAVSEDPYAVAIRQPEERFATIEEIVDYYDANAASLMIATCGEKTGSHAAAQLFADTLEIEHSLLHKEKLDDAYQSLLSTESDVCIAHLSELTGWANIKPVAILVENRSGQEAADDVPTLKELGYEAASMPADSLCLVLPQGASEDMICFYEEVMRLVMIDPRYMDGDNHIFELYHSMSESEGFAQQWCDFSRTAAKELSDTQPPAA